MKRLRDYHDEAEAVRKAEDLLPEIIYDSASGELTGGVLKRRSVLVGEAGSSCFHRIEYPAEDYAAMDGRLRGYESKKHKAKRNLDEILGNFEVVA